jgi:maleylacetoacetate isomerase
MILHGYYRSSASFRVRIALNLKSIAYESTAWHLRHGAHLEAAFGAINSHKLIPVLDDEGTMLTQSLAIIEYLDETHPDPAFLPQSAADRAYVRALAQSIACDIHPIDNLRVLQYLRGNFAADEDAIGKWYNHWIATGFAGLEVTLANDSRTGPFCFGDTPGLADILLVPQVVNAGNYKLDMAPYPTISRIFDACMALPAFANAHPRVQADAE